MLSPGTATFHLIFSVSLQVTGGVAVLEAPVLSGPRQFVQKPRMYWLKLIELLKLY